MDRLLELETAIAVADQGGFATAGRLLGQSAPSVTRHIAELERRLGTQIFARTTRRVSLTAEGEHFIASARGVVAAYREALSGTAIAATEPRGVLTVTAPVLFGQKFVAPLLGELAERHPSMKIEALFLDRVVDLMEEGVDLAVRIGDLPDSSLRARRVGSVRRVVFAAPACLEANGVPARPQDLVSHRIIAASATGDQTAWRFRADGRTVSVRVQPRMSFNSNTAVLDTVIAGHGIGALFSYQVADAIKSGAVAEILADYAVPSVPVHLVHRSTRAVPARIRAAMDYLSDGLAGATVS